MLTLEHTVIEHRLMRHGNGMQACGHSKYHMEVLLRDNLLPSESDPLLPFLVLAFGAMTVTAAVVADLDVSTLRTNLDMAAECACPAHSQVPERLPYRY